MLKILGIVAEYNPFHNGHLYHVKKSKVLSGTNAVVAVISGNFTQRGETSIINKWEKAKMALNNGIDLVIELPTIYSISSAENFANGAIKILNNMGLVNTLSFGIEAESILQINEVADVLYNETDEYKAILRKELDKGISYPEARQNAVVNYLKNDKYKEVLSASNNILGIEYLKVLKQLNSIINPVAVTRKKVSYNDDEIIENFASSTAIRNILKNQNISEIAKVVPQNTFDILNKNIKNGTVAKDISAFSKEIFYKLRTMSKLEISMLPEVSEGLENLIKESAQKTNNLDELINLVKSKRYTQTRIQRILLYALLGITKLDMEMSKSINPYMRILGFNKKGEEILSQVNKDATIITSVKKFEKENKSKEYERLLEIDKMATDIYTLCYNNNSKAGLDYTHPLVK